MKAGVVRSLHAHERVQVAAALGLTPFGTSFAAHHHVYGWTYTHQGWATYHAARNRALYGHTTWTGRWRGQPVALLLLNEPWTSP